MTNEQLEADRGVLVNDPKPYPLAIALNNGWRWLHDDARQTTIILHRSSGLWIEAADDLLPNIDDALAEAIAGPLRTAVIEGRHGQVTILLAKQEDDSICVSIGSVSHAG